MRNSGFLRNAAQGPTCVSARLSMTEQPHSPPQGRQSAARGKRHRDGGRAGTQVRPYATPKYRYFRFGRRLMASSFI